MKLAICTECGELIDLDAIEPLDPEAVIGCGQEENDFTSCHECGNKFGSEACQKLRDDGGWMPTMMKDYKV